MIHKNDKKLKFQCPRIKFYWHTAPSGHLRNACGCSHELHSYSRNHKANAENINSLALYRKCVPVPWSRPTGRNTLYFNTVTQCRHSYLDMDKHTIEKKSINKITPTHPRRPELDPVFSVFFYWGRVSCMIMDTNCGAGWLGFTSWFCCSLWEIV